MKMMIFLILHENEDFFKILIENDAFFKIYCGHESDDAIIKTWVFCAMIIY